MSGLDQGDPVRGQHCPDCRLESLVYNGNYFCTHCGWSMHDGGPEHGIVKAYLIQRLVEAQQKGDAETVEIMSYYLIHGGYVKDGETL